VALVVGNSAFQCAPRLDDPKNDAADIAAELKKHGYDVIEGDLDRHAFEQKLSHSRLRRDQMPKSSSVLATAWVADQNYLVPTDATAKTATLDLEMVRVDVAQRILKTLRQHRHPIPMRSILWRAQSRARWAHGPRKSDAGLPH